MLFRSLDGCLIEINKFDFINDKLYYERIMQIYIPNNVTINTSNNVTNNTTNAKKIIELKKTF